jgi:hypothetical protein
MELQTMGNTKHFGQTLCPMACIGDHAQRQKLLVLKGVSPQMLAAYVTLSSLFSVNNLNSPQSWTTRNDVRMRDLRCLATDQEAVPRNCGGNFTGLEVAHIFPLQGVGQVRHYFPFPTTLTPT